VFGPFLFTRSAADQMPLPLPTPHPCPLTVPPQADVFAGEYGSKRLADLKLRVIEHNVLVVSKYYTCISLARLAELLDLTPLEVRGRGGGGTAVGVARSFLNLSTCRAGVILLGLLWCTTMWLPW
jgi:hypothetical protein